MPEAAPEPLLYGIGASVYARRDGEILILKRAAGAMSGSWYLPGGGLDPGETPEECAVRELEEETGLRPEGPLWMIGVVPMQVYGHESLILNYACDVAAGPVRLSHEHSASRWIRPERFRRDFFREEDVAAIEARSERAGRIVRGVQRDLDRYLGWLERERALSGS